MPFETVVYVIQCFGSGTESALILVGWIQTQKCKKYQKKLGKPRIVMF
jgi:hypothetical protein